MKKSIESLSPEVRAILERNHRRLARNVKRMLKRILAPDFVPPTKPKR
jgi:hypothetical protein